MKMEVTLERQHRGAWRQHARGKFAVDPNDGPNTEAIERWLKEKGAPFNAAKPEQLIGWAIRVAITA